MSLGTVVSLCDKSGVMVRDWAAAGYECICVDRQHSIRRDRVEYVGRGSIRFLWGDVRSCSPSWWGQPAIVFAFPPCTDLAVSGARDFERKGLRLLIDSLEVVEACRNICELARTPWMLENPVGRLSTLWRKPDFTFDPCDYGDPYTKKTCLWTGGGFVMPPKNRVEPTEGSMMHLMAPGPDRANRRAETPAGFARAVFLANAPRNALLEVSA